MKRIGQRGYFMKKVRGAVLLAIAVLGLTGCGGQEKAAEVSSLSFGKNGEIAHKIVGSFEQNYYDMEGLESLAAQRVEEYCAEYDPEAVYLESIKEKSGEISILFHYATAEDYSRFNYRQLYMGTVEEANESGYDLDSIAFISAKGEPIELGFTEDADAKKILIIETKSGENLLVNLEGRVLYINQSANSGQEVSFSGKKSVLIRDQAPEEKASALTYIVYE